MENFRYDIRILSMDSLSEFNSTQAINILGSIFEAAREQKDIKSLSKGLELANTVDVERLSLQEKAQYYYNVANGWAYKHRLRISPNDIEFNHEELIKQIIHMRLALKFCTHDNSLRSEILVNLGNTFNHLGRCSEAIVLWKEALVSNPGFGMAVGNLGFGVFHYGKMLADDVHKSIFMQFAHRALIEGVKSKDVYKEAKEGFKNLIQSIERGMHPKSLTHDFDIHNYSMGDSPEEKDYREWSLRKNLFLNDLNDIYYAPIAAHDYLTLPTMTLKREDSMIYHELFNQIKQEFTSARYFVYLGHTSTNNHFADKGNAITDTMDDSYHSLNVEFMKAGFRICYSVLDKIAIFINRYFNLEIPPNKVSFNKIWYTYKNGQPIEIRDQIKNTENWILRGLYWLSRDLFSDEIDTTDPDARDIAKIRNFIEYKSFKVVDNEEFKETHDGLTLAIGRAQFEYKCIKLIKLIRAAIIYLSLAVYIEESKKRFDGPVVSIQCEPIKDENKV